MTPMTYDRLLQETSVERDSFLSIPMIKEATERGVSHDTYLAFLAEAYHHVKHTWPLLARAASRCGEMDEAYRDALFHYLGEERGHEKWILNDIAALGGDPQKVRQADASVPCQALVAYAYFSIDHISPYAMLGMAHVLEGMSATLATKAAAVIFQRLELAAPGPGDAFPPGFSYLCSHGSLDQDHVQFFQSVVNDITDEDARAAIISTAKVFYRLYGDIFRELDAASREVDRAA
jgi:pyrroloquinoline quinone (PQQ) biosynthesis protein C